MIFAGVAGVLLTILGAAPARARGATVYGLTNNSLLQFTTATPNAVTILPITGLSAGDSLVGIDFRPQNGHMYGLGHNKVAGTVQLYHISHRTGVATPIAATGTFVNSSANPIAIFSSAFGFDFNPVTDRIRVVATGSLNFRMNPNTGAFVDGDMGGAPGSVAGLKPGRIDHRRDHFGRSRGVHEQAAERDRHDALHARRHWQRALHPESAERWDGDGRDSGHAQRQPARFHDHQRIRHPAQTSTRRRTTRPLPPATDSLG